MKRLLSGARLAALSSSGAAAISVVFDALSERRMPYSGCLGVSRAMAEGDADARGAERAPAASLPGDDIAFSNSSLRGAALFYVSPSVDTETPRIFSGSLCEQLTNEIAGHLTVEPGRADVSRFSDGEVSVQINENVRGTDCYVVQPIAGTGARGSGHSVNDSLIELLLMVSTLRRASAKRITVVLPFLGYSLRSPKGSSPGAHATIPAADIAKMIETVGADSVVAVDLHHGSIKGYFGGDGTSRGGHARSPYVTTIDNLDVAGLTIPYFMTKFLRNVVIVSPDENGSPRADLFRQKLAKHGIPADLAVVCGGKTDAELDDISSMDVVGEVENADVVIIDDVCDSSRTMYRAARILKQRGARRVFGYTTHALFRNDDSQKLIDDSELIELVTLNTIPQKDGFKSNKIRQLSVSALLAEAIRRVHKKHNLRELSD